MVGICRLCAAVRKLKMLTTITDTNHAVCHKLRECCHIEIQLEDTLPKCICHECLEALDQAHAFYVKVHESQETLSALFPPPVKQSDDYDELLNTAKSPALTESLALAIQSNSKTLKERETVEVSEEEDDKNLKTEVDIVEGESAEVEEHQEFVAENNVELEAPIVLNEDEVNSMLDKVDEDIEDEVYLIEKILGRKCDEVNLNVNGTTLLNGKSYKQQQKVLKTRRKQEESLKKVKRIKQATAAVEEEYESYQVINDEIGIQQEQEEDELGEEFVLEIMRQEQESKEAKQIITDQELEQLEQMEGTDEDKHYNWNTYTWLCYLCSAEESSYIDLQLHFQVTHDQQTSSDIKFKCHDCLKICPRYYNFVTHVRFRHRKELMLCCDVCNRHCTDFKQLADHRKEEHADNKDIPPILLCEICGHGFKDKNCRSMHMKTHQKNRNEINCDECGKSFSRYATWKSHQKVHSDVKEFSCDQCGKSFRQKVNLDNHILTHVSDKPYECAVCLKAFKTSFSLEKHLYTHTDIKNFKCDYCGNRFRTKDAKLSHERTHTGERPYKCKYCDRTYRFRSTFIGHQNTHTGNRPFSCEACNHHFTNWSNYNKHMKRRHANGASSTPDETKKRGRTAKGIKKADSKSYYVYELMDDDVVSAESGTQQENAMHSLNDDKDFGDDTIFEISEVIQAAASSNGSVKMEDEQDEDNS